MRRNPGTVGVPKLKDFGPRQLRMEPLSPAARRSLGVVAGFLRCYTGNTSLKEGMILTQESTRRCDPKQRHSVQEVHKEAPASIEEEPTTWPGT